MRFFCLILATVVATVTVARPVLQPEVKEYRAFGGTFDTPALPVWHQDQVQCAIAADEASANGKKAVWDGRSCSDCGVYIAIADSNEGRKLVSEFALDVPAKKQGYAISAKDGRVAIVGHDPVGALYGAVTFAQMSVGGHVESATVRDWPDILYRGSVSIGRGIWKLASGEPMTNRMSAIRSGLDEMLRHKLNMICDFYGVEVNSDEKTFAFWREVCRYAAERGIYANNYGSTAIWVRRNAPKDLKFENWQCVKSHVPWNDAYYCWADDSQTEAAANRYADYVLKLGAEKGILIIHPVDGGTWRDPELWSKRCAKCRARWNDHERWKASVNQFNIWTRVLRKRLPKAMIGSCIYPYKFNELLTPEKDRTPQWYEGNADYWRQLSEGMEDKEFFFSSWICSPVVFKEFRKLVPTRPLHFSDTYPLGAGLFNTFNRKAASVWESQSENMFSTQGLDGYLHWESLFLIAEHTWNKDAPGTELYDGGTYYDPLVDHTGPAPVIEDTLVRICKTFWGRDLAPYMHAVMSSGVMPDYTQNPAETVKYWNATRKNPEFDPNIPDEGRRKKGLALIVDSPELMRRQIEAAACCVRELKAAANKLDGLDRQKRKYFVGLAKGAPLWLAMARANWFVRTANEQISKGENASAMEMIRKGREQAESDFNAVDETFSFFAGEPEISVTFRKCQFDRKAAELLFDRTEASAKVTLQPRKIGRKVKLGIAGAKWKDGIKAYFDDFENVEAKTFDSIALSELDRFDCVILADHAYDKAEYFANVKAYVERGGGGVYLEGALCGHKRFDTKTPFPEIVETSSGQVENYPQKMKFADGREGKTMYVDFFGMKPGVNGEVVAYGPDGKTPLAVRGSAGLGKVFFCGTFNLGSVGGTYAEKVEKLHGANAEITKDAVEYLTGVRLKRKGE